MHRHFPRYPAVGHAARAEVLTLADDLSVIARIEAAMRVAAADRPRNRRALAMGRFAEWLAGMR